MFIVRFNCLKYMFVENSDRTFFSIGEVRKIVDSSASTICRSPNPIGALEVLNLSGNIHNLQETINSGLLMGVLDKSFSQYMDLTLHAIVALSLDMQEYTKIIPNEYKPNNVTITPHGYGELFIEPRERPAPSPSYF